MIDVLQEFCNKWGLSVNVNKTKVMVFKKGGKLRNGEKWHMYGRPLETVPLYKYLGLLFTSYLSWTKAVHELSLKAKRAVMMLIMYSIKCGGFPTSVAFELFDKMVLPIISYGAEVWGTQQYKAIEDIQTFYCKKILGLPTHTSNLATLGDCGRFPIHVHCAKKCIKYWLKILNMPNTRYVKCCYNMLKRLDERGKKT